MTYFNEKISSLISEMEQFECNPIQPQRYGKECKPNLLFITMRPNKRAIEFNSPLDMLEEAILKRLCEGIIDGFWVSNIHKCDTKHKLCYKFISAELALFDKVVVLGKDAQKLVTGFLNLPSIYFLGPSKMQLEKIELENYVAE